MKFGGLKFQRSPQGVVGGYQSPQQIPLLTGKLTGTFAETGHPPRFSRLIKHADPIGYSRIPYATEQGISKRVSGNFFKEQGNLVKLSNCSETAELRLPNLRSSRKKAASRGEAARWGARKTLGIGAGHHDRLIRGDELQVIPRSFPHWLELLNDQVDPSARSTNCSTASAPIASSIFDCDETRGLAPGVRERRTLIGRHCEAQ